MSRWILWIATIVMTTGVIVVGGPISAGASFPPVPAGPIVVGATTPLSGPESESGLSTEHSFEGATMKAFEAQFPNGIDGHQVKLTFLDDQGTVTGGVQSANQLVSDHVAAVVTVSYNPEATADQLTILQHAKVPVISTLSGNQYANTKEYPYDFGIGASIPEEAVATAKWIHNEGFTRIAVLDDGLQLDSESVQDLEGDLPKYAPGAKVVTTQAMSPGAVEVAPQISAIEAVKPDLVDVQLSYGFGPVWQTMITDGMTNDKILTSAAAWYEGFTAMGPLTAVAYAAYDDCATSLDETWPASITSLEDAYSAATGPQVNELTSVDVDTVPLLLLRYAIDKEHSDTPAAIKAGIESIHNLKFDTVAYNFTSTNHYGITGADGAAVCQMGPPYAGGTGRIPLISKG